MKLEDLNFKSSLTNLKPNLKQKGIEMYLSAKALDPQYWREKGRDTGDVILEVH